MGYFFDCNARRPRSRNFTEMNMKKYLFLAFMFVAGTGHAFDWSSPGGGGGGSGSGDIEGVTAGAGLSGGGSSGSVTLTLDTSNTNVWTSTQSFSSMTATGQTLLALNNGNVGISTAAPISKLDIYGGTSDIHVGNSFTGGTSSDGFFITASPVTGVVSLIQKEGAALDFYTLNALRLTIASLGAITAQSSVTVNGNFVTTGTATANKFSGDGSLLTNVPGASSPWSYTSGLVITTVTNSQVGIGTTTAQSGYDLNVGTGGVYSLGPITIADDGSGISKLSGTNQINFIAGVSTAVTVSGSTVTIAAAAKLIIPQGTGPTVDATGAIAWDSTDGTLVAYDGDTAKVVAYATVTIPINISSDTTTGFTSLYQPLFNAPEGMPFTITKVVVTALPSGASVQFNLEEVTLANLGSAGTDVFTVTDATATSPGATITALTNPEIAAGSWVVISCPATGAGAGGPNRIVGTIYGLLKRE